MTNAQAAERLQKVLENARAGKSCRIEEDTLILAIWALTTIGALEKEMDDAILYGVRKDGNEA